VPPEKSGLRIDEILRLLRKAYGPRRWKPGRDALSTLISTVLSQNTADVNSHRAFASLISTFGTWDKVAGARTDDIARAIRIGGLAGIKAARIKAILHQIRSTRGALDLEFLRELSAAEAKTWLRGLPGVGPKTAAVVLLFSLDKPSLPVDTHVLRVSRRLGLIDFRTSAEKAHDLLEAMIPPQRVYEFHLQMIEHGRKVCLARRPRCEICPLQPVCPSAEYYLSLYKAPSASRAPGLPRQRTGSRIAGMSDGKQMGKK
jgi:endonuclease-3